MRFVGGKLYRGPRPKSFKELQENGIKHVINLQSGVYEELNNDTYEKEFAGDFGIIEYNIALSDVSAPRKDQVEKVLKIIKSADGMVFIHCLHGKDRTGFMCAIYRMVHNQWPADRAIKEMYKAGFHKFPYILWVPTLKKIGAELTKQA